MKFYDCRPVWVEIDRDAIIQNVNEIKRHIGSQKEIIGVIKGDAYGHGVVEVARNIISAGVKYLAVATVEEGIELREHQIKAPVLILGYTGGLQVRKAIDHNLIMTVYLKEAAEDISKYALEKSKLAKVHIKVNTGMNRIGILPEKSLEFTKFLKSLRGIKIEGVFTHFASAAQKDKTDAYKQYKIFIEVVESIKKIIENPLLIHAANSGATMDMPYTHFDAVRPGRLIYGLYPYPEVKKSLLLKPALSVRAKIIQINRVRAGEGVGYEGIFKSKQDTFTATLPLGFTDGIVSRRTVNQISVILKGLKRPVVAVCADMCMINVGPDLEEISIGDVVTLLGEQDNLIIPIENIAEVSKQSIGGVLSHLSRRLPRIYSKNGNPYLIKDPFEKYIALDSFI